ncbi:hypothetical protein U9M48_020503, partial [Paspalum notatum var. saurae]
KTTSPLRLLSLAAAPPLSPSPAAAAPPARFPLCACSSAGALPRALHHGRSLRRRYRCYISPRHRSSPRRNSVTPASLLPPPPPSRSVPASLFSRAFSFGRIPSFFSGSRFPPPPATVHRRRSLPPSSCATVLPPSRTASPASPPSQQHFARRHLAPATARSHIRFRRGPRRLCPGVRSVPEVLVGGGAPPLPAPYHAAAAAPSAYGGNPYVHTPAGGAATAPKSACTLHALESGSCSHSSGCARAVRFFFADTMDSVTDVLGKMGKRFGEAARKTENITGNFWQHLKTGPSITDAAMGRISQVVIPLAQLRSVNSSTSRTNIAEKYIQVVSVDNHGFWFIGFVYYDSAVKNLLEALQEAQSLRAQ